MAYDKSLLSCVLKEDFSILYKRRFKVACIYISKEEEKKTYLFLIKRKKNTLYPFRISLRYLYECDYSCRKYPPLSVSLYLSLPTFYCHDVQILIKTNMTPCFLYMYKSRLFKKKRGFALVR